ncbi:MAG: asparagine synthase, partial [Methanoregula sp.]|nr:asparagine synthase [Methanoregula sp.]
MNIPKISGWIEINGQRIMAQEIGQILQDHPEKILTFGGEFFLAGNGCRARDHFGIMPGKCPKGTLICNDEI